MDSIMKLWCPARGDQQYSKNKGGSRHFLKYKSLSTTAVLLVKFVYAIL